MSKTQKIFHTDNSELLGTHIIQLIGRLLYEERWKRHISLKRLSAQTNIEPEKIEEIELARGRPKWVLICRLLKHYRKRLAVRLVPVEVKAETKQ